MAKCSYCGAGAGWFSSEHPECRERVESGLTAVRRVFASYLARDAAPQSLAQLEREIAGLTSGARLPREQVREEVAQEWASTVRAVVEAGLPSRERVAQLRAFATEFSLTTDSAHARDADGRLERAVVLRRCIEGDIPEWRGPSPFALRRRERLAWMFADVRYFQDKAPRGRDLRGVPASIANYGGGAFPTPAIYLSSAAFGTGAKSWALNDPVSAYVDEGTLGLTTHNLYFHSTRRTVRIPLTELGELSPYRNALVISGPAEGALAQAFALPAAAESWFAYNLAANLAQRAGTEVDDPSGEYQGERSVA